MGWVETTRLKAGGLISVRTEQVKKRQALRISGLLRIMGPSRDKTRVEIFLGDGQEYGKLKLVRSETAGFAVTRSGQVTITWPRGDYIFAEMPHSMRCPSQWDDDNTAVTIDLPECLLQKSEEAA